MKKLKIGFITLLTLILTSANIKAQGGEIDYFAFGLKLSGGVSDMIGMSKYRDRIPGTYIESPDFRTKPYPTFELSGVVQAMFKSQILIQAELGVSNYGINIRHSPYVSDFTSFYLTSHLYLGTKIPINDRFRFVVLGGGFLESNLSYFYDEDFYDYYGYHWNPKYPNKASLDLAEADYKQFDGGLSASVGFEIYNWQIAYTYDYGLVHIVNDEHKLQSRKYKLGITYFFTAE